MVAILAALCGLVCLAGYKLWRMHRKRGEGLQGSMSLCCECAMILGSGGAVVTEATGNGLAQKKTRRCSVTQWVKCLLWLLRAPSQARRALRFWVTRHSLGTPKGKRSPLIATSCLGCSS